MTPHRTCWLPSCKWSTDRSALPKSTPSGIRSLLRRCLERDRKQRLRDIGEARIAIDEQTSLGAAAGQENHVQPKGVNLRKGIIAFALASLVIAAGVVGLSRLPRGGYTD